MKNLNFFNRSFKISEISFKSDSVKRRIFWGFIFFLIANLLLGINFIPQQITLEPGQPSEQDFIAPHDHSYESEVLTVLAREEAAAQVEPVYRLDENLVREFLNELDNYLDEIAEIKDADLEYEDKVERVKELELGLSEEEISVFLNAEESRKEEILQESQLLLENFVGQELRAEEVEEIESEIIDAVYELDIAEEDKVLLVGIFNKLPLKESVVFDPQATEEKKDQAKQEVAPIEVDISENQKIVGRGEIVSELQIEQLQELGLLEAQQPYTNMLGLSLLIAIMFVLIAIYLHQNNREILEKEHLFILLGLLFLSILLIARAVTALDLGNEDISALVGYLIPLAAGSMLIAILLDYRLAVIMTVLMGIIIGIMTGNQIQYAIVATAGGLAGIYSVSDLSQRSDLTKASLYIILANVTAIISMGLILDQPLTNLTIAVTLGIINGIVSTVLTIGLLPFWESAFGITTSVRLLELSNPNQPLLKRLLMEAPGTYHHSIITSNLAEPAADEVGANSLLTRVGAYYHDIGKLKRPYFFIENQLTANNPHDKLTPNLSSLIITAHVKDGYELAQKHKLPEKISDIVLQHHGNSILSYFYNKAVENCCSNEDVPDNKFRYDSQKPRTKEAAIVMLADTVEAGVRAMQKPNPNKIENFIKRSIKEKLEDGQLDECDLTFKDLNLITNAFIRILSGIFHHRIEYPEKFLKEAERGVSSKNGNSYKG